MDNSGKSMKALSTREINWGADPWFAAHHARQLTDSFKDWWVSWYGHPDDFPGENETREYWVRCSFALAGWQGVQKHWRDVPVKRDLIYPEKPLTRIGDGVVARVATPPDRYHDLVLDASGISISMTTIPWSAVPASLFPTPALQYYSKRNEYLAKDAHAKDCICWHDKGTGPCSIPEPGLTWRVKPHE